ncbi:MAG: hypothetical protein KME49_27855 [Brasilonema octagenarum HA4186-MV1]|jgi:hypothetical protein|uniref:Uncharacterized protein n=2 Tax=Brasilonema TaxID=383614 RepID=A0A856MRF4_9CYAN|nr:MULTISPECIES: hypothetical protein [Brasilonema]MBW4629220.1 hypothetical protein [Brasilonema octagenarum HA4186-MV1]NMF66767.1 hypothetical protein [Brasilonema octagenarum UFV-OR1]QDL11686.1 hypothetical protein DP114_30720 [Brasilonema sennae CENA114]QDL18067.1 hypothetical protein DP113_30860 [Brasilonema octagenarum UFV-E1]
MISQDEVNEMGGLFFRVIKTNTITPRHRFLETPEADFNQNSEALLIIKVLKNCYLNGTKLVIDSVESSKSVLNDFQTQLKKSLNIVKTKLAEFKKSQSYQCWILRKVESVVCKQKLAARYCLGETFGGLPP